MEYLKLDNTREIKVRAWEKEEKIICEVESINYLSKRIVLIAHMGAFSISTVFKDVIFMQYTGLKDKYGKEIYAGDIIDIAKEVDGNIKIIRTFVKYSAPHFLTNYGHGCWLTSSCEVIGNIYENPELLKAKL